jgi:hypothetical protein
MYQNPLLAQVSQLSKVYKFENKEWAAVLSFPNNGTRATQDIIMFKSFITFIKSVYAERRL